MPFCVTLLSMTVAPEQTLSLAVDLTIPLAYSTVLPWIVIVKGEAVPIQVLSQPVGPTQPRYIMTLKLTFVLVQERVGRQELKVDQPETLTPAQEPGPVAVPPAPSEQVQKAVPPGETQEPEDILNAPFSLPQGLVATMPIVQSTSVKVAPAGVGTLIE